MHDGIDVEFAEDPFQQRFIARITDNQLAERHRRLEARAQVVECHDVFARGAELANDVAANVARAAGDKYRLVLHGRFVFVLSFRPEI